MGFLVNNAGKAPFTWDIRITEVKLDNATS
jgi:hypothetical protein